MNEIIKVKNAVKIYKETKALDDISVNFERGKIHGIIGRNGSGKTVLLRCICGLSKLTSGSIIVDGKELGRDIDIPENIGAIIEYPGFIPEMSGYKNLKYLADIKGVIDKKRILDVLKIVGLENVGKKRVGKYSLGMRQRLGIAQAIMESPEILILDEPTNGLDKNGVKEFRELMIKLKEEGKTIIIASHNSEDINFLCEDIIELDKGRIESGGNV
ncbi:MAG: ATP-binding cassette domain-containing protein [Lachnospiraceae bacterium]|nr:ATP-binding cassette domain-containing protein [Lachnospiraceae bacterium]